MLEATVDVVVLVYQEMNDVLNAKDVKAVLDLLCVDLVYYCFIIKEFWERQEFACRNAPKKLLEELYE